MFFQEKTVSRWLMLLSCILFFLCTVLFGATPNEIITVTVRNGERQTFRGLGGSFEYYPYNPEWKDYTLVQANLRDSMAHLLFGDNELNLRFLRIWSAPLGDMEKEGYSVKDYYAPQYKTFIQHAKKFQPNLKVYHTPFSQKWRGQRIGNVSSWAYHSVAQIELFRKHGVQIDYSGIANEPEVHDEINQETAPILVHQYRRELDRRGLRDIKVVGPESAATDPKARGIIRSIIDDPDALQALDVFSVHSYNWSITDEMERMIEPLIIGGEKELWQTESGAGPCVFEREGNAEQASDVIAKFLADMNHLCNVWMFYSLLTADRDWDGGLPKCGGWIMGHYRNWVDNTFEECFVLLLKYYYFKQISRTFTPGSVFRKSIAHANRVSGKYWRSEDTTMVFAYGEKAPLYLAAAVNPDGSWAIAINNHTGFRNDPYSTPRPRVNFEVRVTVEELKEDGDIPFAVHRCNAQPGNPADPHIHPEDTIYMRDGVVIIDSLGQYDLLTLRSPPATGPISSLMPSARHQEFVKRLTIRGYSRASVTRIRFAVERAHGAAPAQKVSVDIYDCRGNIVRTIHRGNLPSGEHEYVWDNRTAAGALVSNGTYFVRVTGSARAQNAPLIFVD